MSGEEQIKALLAQKAPLIADIIKDCPKNWGKWGENDEVGALNYLGPAEALKGKLAIQQGKTFTLQVPIGHPDGDPMAPIRKPPIRTNVIDKGHYLCGKAQHMPGGAEYCDDMIVMYLQGSTQYDALAHAWVDDKLWNGYDASTTSGSVQKASILPIAEKGIVGRGVLIDMAKHRNKVKLDNNEPFSHKDLLEAAAKQGVTIEKRDILLIRTGVIESYYTRNKSEPWGGLEPGLTFSKELVEWFQEMEIPNLVTDTFGNEVTFDPVHGVICILHSALMRNLGVTFTEVCNLGPLAEDCAKDGQYTFMYTAAPLKIYGGTGAPVNPVVIK